jgi:hypothetical protein
MRTLISIMMMMFIGTETLVSGVCRLQSKEAMSAWSGQGAQKNDIEVRFKKTVNDDSMK